jgi:mannose-6-phosphate isomerase-like protein (cupin superfamily)
VPEIYLVTAGKAAWTVDDETRVVTAGMTIYAKSGAIHKMVNLTDEPVKAIWVWWAPGGDSDVFAGEYEFTEPTPDQVKGAELDASEAERLY